jgi:flagellin-like protein
MVSSDPRGVSAVVGTTLLVAVVVVLAAVVGSYTLGLWDRVASPAPNVTLEYERISDAETAHDGEALRVTLTNGNALQANQVAIISTTPIDLYGGATGFYEPGLTKAEKLSEGPSDQTGIGETWESGESIMIGTEGNFDGVTLRFVWNPDPIEKDVASGSDTAEVLGDSSYVVQTFRL